MKGAAFSLPLPGATAAVIAAVAFLDHDFGPSYLISALFSLTAVRSCISRYLIYKTAACTEKETFYDHLRYVAGVVIFDF